MWYTETTQTLDKYAQDKYKYGFVTDIETEKISKGLRIFLFVGLIIFAIFSLLITSQFYKIKYGLSKINSSNKLLIFSLALLLLPAVPVALTGHQAELVEAGYGYGYIVVFIQYFGAVALFLMIVKYLKKYSECQS